MNFNVCLPIRYSIFAIIATAANICGQEFVVQIYKRSSAILVSVVVGTGVGLVVKYFLDKHYIFRFRARSTAHDVQAFVRYIFMGLVTTVIFWGFEFCFHRVFETKEMRYIGGAIGLSIGYLIKYRLDKRFVFRKELE